MDSGGTGMSTSSVPHQLVYLCRQHPIPGVLPQEFITMHKMKVFTQLKYKCPCPLCPCISCGHAERSQSASDKQQTMEANLVNGLHIKSTGSHEVLHHGEMTKIGCYVQGCVPIIIRVKEVVLHLGSKVLSNRKMTANGTQVKGIAFSLN